MRARPCRGWPTWFLHFVVESALCRSVSRWSGLWGEAFIELHLREVVEPMRAYANDESGPWLVSPPRGFH